MGRGGVVVDLVVPFESTVLLWRAIVGWAFCADVGGVIVSMKGLEVAPPGPGATAVIVAVPGLAIKP